jgi:hypothetical protein
MLYNIRELEPAILVEFPTPSIADDSLRRGSDTVIIGLYDFDAHDLAPIEAAAIALMSAVCGGAQEALGVFYEGLLLRDVVIGQINVRGVLVLLIIDGNSTVVTVAADGFIVS